MSVLFTAPTDDSWMRQAACRDKDIDPEIFFPTHENGPSLSLARGICQRCHVRQECLLYAMAVEGNKTGKNRPGVYAGMTGGQRAGLYERTRDRAKQRKKTVA